MLSAIILNFVAGASTTILSVLPLIRHPSYVIVTFTKMIILVIVLGLLHGLLLLPVLLTLFGPGSCTKKQRRPKTHSQINIMSPIATVSETFIYETGQNSSLKQFTLRKSKCISPQPVKNNPLKLFQDHDKRSPGKNCNVNRLHLSFFKPSESDVSDSNMSEEAVIPPFKVDKHLFQ